MPAHARIAWRSADRERAAICSQYTLDEMPTPYKRDQDLIAATLREEGLEAYEAVVLGLAQPSVQFKTRRADVPVGKSKVGGDPDLPLGEPWPTREQIPFTFVGQLDLAEVTRHLPSSPLPDSGLLLFFFDTSDFHLGRDVCRVIHAKGPVARRPAPEAPEEVFVRFRECALELTKASAVPDLSEMGAHEDRIAHLSEDVRSALGDCSAQIQDELVHFDTRHELLGHPRRIQPVDPLVELAQLEVPGLSVQDVERRCAAARTYRQLIAFDADEEASMPWADMGTLWFLIGVDDLARHDFSRVAAVAQTH